MSAGSETQSYTPYERLVAHLRTPLYRNGYMLALSSLATSGIGLIYWIIAARKFPAYDVGINTAVISSMTFLASIAEINLMSALIRFIPIAGRSTKRFVIYSYLVSLVVAATIGIIYIKNIANWSPALKFLGEDPALSIWFVLATMLWCIFVLQDSVLTGLRRASWVPLENTVFSLTKIALIIIFAVSLPTMGIFASWSLALIVAVLPTNYFIFRKLIPIHAKQDQENGGVEPRQVVRYVMPDYLGTLFWIVSITLMPVIVTTVAGATANAYYYLSWTIANTLYLIGPSMGSSMVVESANNPHKLGEYSYRIFKNMLKLVLPAAVIVAIGAPLILMVFGKGYSSQGSMLLRFLAFSAVPSTINALFINVSRVQRRMVAVVLTSGSLYTLSLVLSYILLRLMGITGVGIGWLIAQSTVASVVYWTQLRKLWMSSEEVDMKTRVKLPITSETRSIIHMLYRIASSLGLLPLLTSQRKRMTLQKRQNKVSSLLPKITKQLPNDIYDPSRDNWKVQYMANNETNCSIAFFGPSNDTPPIVLKLPGNQKEADSLKRQCENLIFLYNEERLGDWRDLLPVIISTGKVDGQAYYAESALPGLTVLDLIHQRGSLPDTVNLAAGAISTLHQKTATSTVIGMDQLETWVNEPLNRLSHYISPGLKNSPYKHAIERLETELNVALAGQEICVSWIHGDYSPANVLTNHAGTEITGIVDWDLARPNDLPLLDLMHLLLSIRMETSQAELGHIIHKLLINDDWTDEELQIIHQAESGLPGYQLSLRVLLLLTWLSHINANLSKTSRYDRNSVWASENIVPVLRTF